MNGAPPKPGETGARPLRRRWPTGFTAHEPGRRFTQWILPNLCAGHVRAMHIGAHWLRAPAGHTRQVGPPLTRSLSRTRPGIGRRLQLIELFSGLALPVRAAGSSVATGSHQICPQIWMKANRLADQHRVAPASTPKFSAAPAPRPAHTRPLKAIQLFHTVTRVSP